MRPAAFTLLGLLLAAASLQAQDPKKPDEQAQESTANQAVPKSGLTGSAVPGNDTAYKIGPQDILRIDVWKEPEVTRNGLPVRPDGKISLPLLNDVQAAGLSPLELSNVITEGLKKFMNNPQVTVTVLDINSRRVYVTGEVTRPGSFPLLPNMTVLQALTTAGAFTQFARTKGIYVLRNEGGKQVKYPFNYKEVIKGNHPEQNIELRSGDTIVVP
jgi:polysaccharide export outer membrane protein